MSLFCQIEFLPFRFSFEVFRKEQTDAAADSLFCSNKTLHLLVNSFPFYGVQVKH